MIEYVHKPCGHVVAIFKGDKPIVSGAPLRSSEWLIGDKHPVSTVGFICSNCLQKFFITPKYVKPKTEE